MPASAMYFIRLPWRHYLQFRTTLLARRFAGLQKMTDEQIKELIVQDRKATGRIAVDPRTQVSAQ